MLSGARTPIAARTTIGLAKLPSLKAPSHWRTVRSSSAQRATSIDREAPVAHGYADRQALCSARRTRSAREARERSSCVKVWCSLTSKGIVNPVTPNKRWARRSTKSLVEPHEVVEVQRQVSAWSMHGPQPRTQDKTGSFSVCHLFAKVEFSPGLVVLNELNVQVDNNPSRAGNH